MIWGKFAPFDTRSTTFRAPLDTAQLITHNQLLINSFPYCDNNLRNFIVAY